MPEELGTFWLVEFADGQHFLGLEEGSTVAQLWKQTLGEQAKPAEAIHYLDLMGARHILHPAAISCMSLLTPENRMNHAAFMKALREEISPRKESWEGQ